MAVIREIVNVSNVGFPLETGDTMRIVYVDDSFEEKTYYSDDDIPEPTDNSIPIKITGIEGNVIHNGDFTWVTGQKNSDITVSFDLDVPDREFNMPISSRVGGLGEAFRAKVVNGKGTVVLNFDNTGFYTYTDDEANMDIAEGTFSISKIYIDIVKTLAV